MLAQKFATTLWKLQDIESWGDKVGFWISKKTENIDATTPSIQLVIGVHLTGDEVESEVVK